MIYLIWITFFISSGCDTALDVATQPAARALKGKVASPNLSKYDPKSVATIVKNNQDLVIPGINYSPNTVATIDNKRVETFRAADQSIGLKIPEGLTPHKLKVVITDGDQVSEINNVFYHKEDDYPIITANPTTICSSQKFYNESGVLVTGQKLCKIEDPNLKPENIRAGISIGQITGSILNCTSENELGCVSNDSYKVTEASELAKKIPKGNTIAGIAGEFELISHPDCSADGETGCKSNMDYRAALITELASKILIGEKIAGVTGTHVPDFPDASNVLNTDTVNKAAGTLTLPTTTNVLSLISYGAGGSSITGSFVVPTSPQVLTGITYGAPGSTITGTAIAESHSDCDAANQIGCISTSTYRTMDLSNKGSGGAVNLNATNFNTRVKSSSLFEYWDESGVRHTSRGDNNLIAANIKSATTIFDVTGSAIETPGACGTNGSQDCVAKGLYFASEVCNTNKQKNCYLSTTGSFEATDFTNIIPENIRSSITIAGVTGNIALPDISNVQESVKYGANSNQYTGTLKVPIESNVGNSVGYGAGGSEYTGTADIESHSDCTAEGEKGCISTATFIAVDTTSGIEAKVVSGQSVAGVSGNAALPSVTHVLTGTTYGIPGASVTGTLTLPAAGNVLAGTGNYGNPSSSISPSLTPDFASVGNVLNTDTVNGVQGTLTLPSANDVLNSVVYGIGGNSITGNMISPSADKVLTGETYGVTGSLITGTAIAESHSDCTAANQSGCIATAQYKTIDLSNKGNSSAVGLTSTNFNTRVRSASLFEYWDENGVRHTGNGDADLIASNLRNLVDIFGVIGSVKETLSPCSTNGSQNCIATGNYYASTACNTNGQDSCYLPSAGSFEAANFAAIQPKNILSTATIAGVSGNLALPTTTDVEFSTTYGKPSSTQTGQLKVPAESNVASTIKYGAAGNEFTGTANIESHSNCTSESQTGCLSNSSYLAVDTGANIGNKVISGQSVAGVSGNVTLPTAGNVLSGVNYGNPSSLTTGTLTLPAAGNVLSGTSNYGNPSSQVTPSYSPDFPDPGSVLATDTVNGSSGTITNRGTWNVANSFAGAGVYTNTSNVPAKEDIKIGVTAFGKTGTYPSSGNPLLRYVDSGATTNTSGSDITDLGDFAAAARTAGTWEYWTSSGVRKTATGDSNLAASNIRSSTVIHGVTGNVAESPSNCSSNGDQGCIATSTYYAAPSCANDKDNKCYVTGSFKAGDLSNLKAENIKSGTIVAGTTGAYPSVSYPLTGNSAAPDLENATFNIRIKSSTTFEYWTSDGTKHTDAGSTDIQETNIKNAETIFGTTGTYTGVP